MSNISQSSQATISQALTQLSQLTASSEVARQGVEVLVKHLAGNVLSLSRNTALQNGLQNKDVLLNNPQIKGKLAAGETLQIKLSVQGNASLEFFSAVSAKSTSVITLTEQQLKNLLKLPANQLIPRNLLTKPINLELPVKPVLQQLRGISGQQNQELMQKLQTLLIDKISLQIKPSGKINLLLQSVQPVASISVTKEIAQALAPLKLPNQQAMVRLLNLTGGSGGNSTSNGKQVQVSSAEPNINIQKLEAIGTRNAENVRNADSTSAALRVDTASKLNFIAPTVDANKYQVCKLSMQDAASNLLTAIQEKPIPQSAISQNLLTNKPAQINLIQSLLRIVQAKAEVPAITLQSIEKALVDVDFFKGATEQSSKQLVAQVLQQIKQALPQGKEQDANQIRQLLTTPALNLSALQILGPTSNQGLMSGLVALLQMSLSARLARNQSGRAEHIATTLNNVLDSSDRIKPPITKKALHEMSQMEQKHQLIKEVGRLLSTHQANKLSNAEQMIQGQETFYYSLPSALGGTFKDIELLIKREEDDKETASTDEDSHKTWQLTMKLAVGEMGEILTKAKLRADTLEINFYASNEAVQIQVMNYLPLLCRKLDSLGIEVSKSHCQLGKIPDTLQQRPHHVFQAKA